MSGGPNHADTGTGPAAIFRRAFGYRPAGVWAAPGRINIIGEHTDYNDGFALPFALPQELALAAAPRGDGLLRVCSRQAGEVSESRVDPPDPDSAPTWAAYPFGAVWELRRRGHEVPGLDLAIDSDIPRGAGLSSSAALTCAAALAAADLGGLDLDRGELARVAQAAENDFVGMPCGLMDQAAVLSAVSGHALFFDARTEDVRPVPFDPATVGVTVLVVDTRAPHRHVGGEYAARRRTCEDAARTLGVTALRDLTTADLQAAFGVLDDAETRRRVRHVVTENERVLSARRLLLEGRLSELGPLLSASHVSLRDDYEVSVPEVDAAVEAATSAGAWGARITGGGFGGCVIALVEADSAPGCTTAVREAFRRADFAEPHIFEAHPSAGARRTA
jgi:galactokinase